MGIIMNMLGWKKRFLMPLLVVTSLVLFGAITYLVFSSASSKTIEISANPVHSDTTKSSNNNSSDSFTLTVVFLVVILILLSLSIFTNILLFKWRFKSSNDQVSVVPLVLMETIEVLMQEFIKMGDQLSTNVDESKNESKNTKNLFNDLMEAFTVLQTALDSRDKEIRRLKKGYDSEIFRKYLLRFIRIDDALSDEIESAMSENNKTYKGLQDIQSLLRDAFDECGVSAFSPKIGANIRNEFGVADNYRTKPAKNKDEEFTIAEVLESGLKLQTPSGPECIKPAKVTVFTLKKGD